MARSARRLASHARIPSELALLGTVAIHAGLFLLFRVATPAEPTIVAEQPPACVLVPPLSRITSLPSPQWILDINAWCFLADPTLMSLPNDVYGFGSVRRDERVVPLSDIPTYTIEGTLRAEEPPSALPAPAPFPSLTSQISAYWTMGLPPLPARQPQGRMPRGIVWYYADGTIIKDGLTLDPDRVDGAVTGGEDVTHSTRVEVNRETPFARVRARRSCGNALLDELLIDEMKRFIFERENAAKRGLESPAVSWLPGTGEARAFEVEWRLIGEPE